MQMTEVSFGTFWSGADLSPLEAACLRSFAIRGYEVTLYSYARLAGVPEDVRQADAAEILDQRYLGSFVFGGRPNLSHFSDLFRYRMFEKTPHIWIDADMLMVRPFDQPVPSSLLAREHQGSICGAIMRIASDDPLLPELSEAALSLVDKNLRWGETGPLLLSRLLGKQGRRQEAFGPDAFYPLAHNEFWKAFLPEYAEECRERCQTAYTVHLWNNIVSTLGVWKVLAPPTGSFLHARLEEDGALPCFSGVYPAAIMRQMVENWRLRKNGGDLGIRGVSRQIIPSVFRTMRHHGIRVF